MEIIAASGNGQRLIPILHHLQAELGVLPRRSCHARSRTPRPGSSAS
jgi:hypothetical protein